MQTYEEQKPLILVADDDETVRMIACECLRAAGFAVEEAENGQAALDRCIQTQPDAVMLDVLMPVMDGYEGCRKIRALPGNENLPILMMTALDDVESIHAAYDAGATEFTGKPVNWTVEAHRLKGLIRAAQAVKQVYISKQEWERTFNALDEIITIQTPDQTIVQANAAAVAATRKPSESLIGKHCSEFFCSALGGCGECPVKEVIASGRKKVVERVDECMEGTFLVSVFPVFDDAGSITRIVHMAKDITERQQLEAEVRRAQKMDAVGTLSGGLAHDFNNLLQVIIGYAELLSLGMSKEDKAHQQLEFIKDAAWRGSEITRQLLTVSRKVESKKQRIALNGIVESVAKLLERTIPKMISLELVLSDGLQTISADPAQLEQVLMNLAVNAKHAMPKGGKLRFETCNTELDADYCRMHPDVEPGDYVMLSVTDTGCGMDEETMARIFEPFFTTRSPDKGTGLGLAMVYGIVQKHEGHLLCYSEVGEGTVFKIYLPVADAAQAAAETAAAQDAPAPGGKEVVLLADDVANIRHLAKKILTRAGYTVMLAIDGEDALEIHAEEHAAIDFVILDLNMPTMGGLECLDTLRVRNPEMPVLLASGFAKNKESEKRLDAYTDYINKPYNEREFLLKIRELLDRIAVYEQEKAIPA